MVMGAPFWIVAGVFAVLALCCYGHANWKK